MENKTPRSFDHTHDLLNLQANPLSTFFSPQSIALIGASEKEQCVGRTTFENLLRGKFKGPVYPVNPSRNTILAHRAFKSVLDLPGKADLAVIVTPAQAVPNILLPEERA